MGNLNINSNINSFSWKDAEGKEKTGLSAALDTAAKANGVNLDINKDGKVDANDKIFENIDQGNQDGKITKEEFINAVSNYDSSISSYQLGELWKAVTTEAAKTGGTQDSSTNTTMKIEGNKTVNGVKITSGSNAATGAVEITTDFYQPAAQQNADGTEAAPAAEQAGSVRSISIPDLNIDVSSIFYNQGANDANGNLINTGISSITINGINYQNTTNNVQISNPDANGWCSVKNDKNEIVAKFQLTNAVPITIKSAQVLFGSKIRTMDFTADTAKKGYTINNVKEYKTKDFSAVTAKNLYRNISATDNSIATYSENGTTVRNKEGDITQETLNTGSKFTYGTGANATTSLAINALSPDNIPTTLKQKGEVVVKITNLSGTQIGTATYSNGKLQGYESTDGSTKASTRYDGDTLISVTEYKNNVESSIKNYRNNVKISYEGTGASVSIPSSTIQKKYVPDVINNTSITTMDIKDRTGAVVGKATYENGKLQKITENASGAEVWTPGSDKTKSSKKNDPWKSFYTTSSSTKLYKEKETCGNDEVDKWLLKLKVSRTEAEVKKDNVVISSTSVQDDAGNKINRTQVIAELKKKLKSLTGSQLSKALEMVKTNLQNSLNNEYNRNPSLKPDDLTKLYEDTVKDLLSEFGTLTTENYDREVTLGGKILRTEPATRDVYKVNGETIDIGELNLVRTTSYYTSIFYDTLGAKDYSMRINGYSINDKKMTVTIDAGSLNTEGLNKLPQNIDDTTITQLKIKNSAGKTVGLAHYAGGKLTQVERYV